MIIQQREALEHLTTSPSLKAMTTTTTTDVTAPQPQQESKKRNRRRRFSSIKAPKRFSLRRRSSDDSKDETTTQPTSSSSDATASTTVSNCSSSLKTEILSSITTIASTTTPHEQATTSPDADKELTSTALVERNKNALMTDDATTCMVLQHFLCGNRKNNKVSLEEENLSSQEMNLLARQNLLPEDPTVEESIECIFSHQLEQGFDLLDLQDDEEDDDDELLWNKHPSSPDLPTKPPRMMQRRTSGSILHVGTFDPTISNELLTPRPTKMDDLSKRTTTTCRCKLQKTPVLHPKDWPQAPLLLRPTPNSGTRVLGVRFAHSTQYLWSPNDSTTWPRALQKAFNISSTNPHWKDQMCEECVVLPINNGNEAPGESLVVDFCSKLFSGTLLLRIRDTHGTTPPSQQQEQGGYFEGMNRRYQVVIRGQFLRPLDMTQCSTGFVLERPCGKLPPKWITKGAIKVVHFFAPQLQVQLNCDRPSSLSPLGSTPQVVRVNRNYANNNSNTSNNGSSHYQATASLEDVQYEPTVASETLLGVACNAPQSLTRARFRKRHFDKLVVDKHQNLVSTDAEYSFEFLQHMIRFTDFEVDLGTILGSLSLCDMLDGQPIQIMAMKNDGEQKLWSFDLWHADLVETSKLHD